MSLLRRSTVLAFLFASLPSLSAVQAPQTVHPGSAMRWRHIGPTRAGRARAAAGVPSQPNVAYIGFDNGGVWRSTDYGSNWTPIFDNESTGSIGAIAVSPSNPNVIYVGTGAGIIRPDLATGDGIYKSTDTGRTWTRLGLADSQMIANIEVDPRNPDRLFVAVLGHPYGPSAERGIFRSTNGGRTFEKVLYKDEYTSANDVRLDPSDPNIVYAALWVQQQAFNEGGAFGGPGGGIFKSTDGGSTWKPLTEGLPSVIQANLGIAQSNPKVVYAMVAGVPATAAPARGPASTTGTVNLYRSNDGGEHWFLAVRGADGHGTRAADPRPLARIGGGDLPPLGIDPTNENVVYSCSVVFWRSEDGGITWSAVRGAPGGDDYQKVWINPTNPDILIVVTDQGAVISANRGESWSNWYTQPTAAMYHASTDNAFPYRVCGGQQDSGSACVDSRGNDGQITFRDWRPVNIQEYGQAASDPKNPDLVYGSSRSTVTLYNRRTGQTKNVGPAFTADDTGKVYNRNVRTMPLEWSPANPNLLFYAQNAVYETRDGGTSWARVSGDLARQAWEVPANAGRYAGGVTASPLGAITALSPSPLDERLLWAGTDDGQIHVMRGLKRTWTNVTPPSIKPWTRIFNIEAGHFDPLTAYAAANTLRLDDLNPHFYRTHDGGKTWTEINTGIAPGAAANSIREDPRQKGLLYAATDTQVWVSFDDGDHWESLRLNMPAISVRDLTVKDDDSCKCADLVAATHGRGFWILDGVTPLREAAAIHAAQLERRPYLVKPATGVRVRFAMNDPTPWPPEVPAGENPPPGAILDYFLAEDARGPVTIEILDAGGQVVRRYASTDPVPNPAPAIDPVAYNRLCQENPTAPDCSVPLYWPAPPMVVSAKSGMHRIWWDMRYDPVGESGGRGGATGAVPRRTYPAATSPWAPPGSYTVRLTADGRSTAQPLHLVLDPRVKIPPMALSRLTSLTSEMYDLSKRLRRAYESARALSSRLEAASGDGVAAFKTSVDALAPPPAAAGTGRGGRGGPPAADIPPTLSSASASALAAAMAMQGAETAPTAREVEACNVARAQGRAVLSRFTTLTTTELAALNAKRKAAGLPEIR
jgi:photosystem II stability/assembly factor-like uncharacterized protein